MLLLPWLRIKVPPILDILMTPGLAQVLVCRTPKCCQVHVVPIGPKASDSNQNTGKCYRAVGQRPKKV